MTRIGKKDHEKHEGQENSKTNEQKGLVPFGDKEKIKNTEHGIEYTGEKNDGPDLQHVLEVFLDIPVVGVLEVSLVTLERQGKGMEVHSHIAGDEGTNLVVLSLVHGIPGPLVVERIRYAVSFINFSPCTNSIS
jgi:hypothetical protein